MAYLDLEGLKNLNKRLGTVFVRRDKIANNLTTTTGGMVLDARQGKALSEVLSGKAGMQVAEVTLLSDSWTGTAEGFEQTVSLSGITADQAVIVAAAPENYMAYAECSIYCAEQGTGTLVFLAASMPQQDLTVNVLILQ